MENVAACCFTSILLAFLKDRLLWLCYEISFQGANLIPQFFKLLTLNVLLLFHAHESLQVFKFVSLFTQLRFLILVQLPLQSDHLLLQLFKFGCAFLSLLLRNFDLHHHIADFEVLLAELLAQHGERRIIHLLFEQVVLVLGLLCLL